jgi:transposase
VSRTSTGKVTGGSKPKGEVFVAFDVAKARNAVSIAEGGRDGEVRYFGEIDNTFEATRKLILKLASRYQPLTFCYEAGPTGYGLYRWIKKLGYECLVVAPSLIPSKPGDRVKTNRRDANNLVKLLRANELTAVWVPDEKHEAMRDLTRTRDAAVKDLRAQRQQVTSFLLRYGRSYPGKKRWGAMHAQWLAKQKLDHIGQRIAFEELLTAVRQAKERLERLEAAITEFVPQWSLAPVVEALQALRGMDLISAATFLAEIGDLSRFPSPRELMAYLGLVPSEHSTGDSVKRGAITKTGNSRARRTLVESAWGYRHPARVSANKQRFVERAPRRVREIAWKAQVRLCGRYRRLMARGKLSTVAITAVARELAGFIWAIGQEVAPIVRS